MQKVDHTPKNTAIFGVENYADLDPKVAGIT